MSITLACLLCCTGCSVQKQEDGAVASATTESVNTETMMTDHSLQEIPYTTSKGDTGYIYASDSVLNSDQNHPLILVMTYTTGNAKAVIRGCGWDTLAENEDVILISPEYDNYATYSETERLKRDIDYAIQNYKVDTSRIYTTGFSNGGAASVAMVSCYPDAFAAMSAMGWMVDMQGQNSSYDIPFQVIQGTNEYTQTINGMPAIMDDERNAIHSLFLYNEMISTNTVEDYGDVPYWGYQPDDTYQETETNGDSLTFNNYFKQGYTSPYAQLVLVDGAQHEMHPWEAETAWNFMKNFRRTEKGIEDLNSQDTSDQEAIVALYQKMQNAMITKDTEYLKSVMPDHVTHIDGEVQTIDEWLDDVSSERMKYYSIDLQNISVSIVGNTATLSCDNVIHARIYGSEGTWTLPGSASFIKDDTGWHFNIPKEQENED